MSQVLFPKCVDQQPPLSSVKGLVSRLHSNAPWEQQLKIILKFIQQDPCQVRALLLNEKVSNSSSLSAGDRAGNHHKLRQPLLIQRTPSPTKKPLSTLIKIVLDMLLSKRSKIMTSTCQLLTKIYLLNYQQSDRFSIPEKLTNLLLSKEYLLKLLQNGNKLISSSANQLIKTILISVKIVLFPQLSERQTHTRAITNFLNEFLSTKNTHLREQISIYLLVITGQQQFRNFPKGHFKQNQLFWTFLQKGQKDASSKVRQNIREVKTIIEKKRSEAIKTSRSVKKPPLKINQDLQNKIHMEVSSKKSSEKRSYSVSNGRTFYQKSEFIEKESVIIKGFVPEHSVSIDENRHSGIQEDSTDSELFQRNSMNPHLNEQIEKELKSCIVKLLPRKQQRQEQSWSQRHTIITRFLQILNELLCTTNQNNVDGQGVSSYSKSIDERLIYGSLCLLSELMSQRKKKINFQAARLLNAMMESYQNAEIIDQIVQSKQVSLILARQLVKNWGLTPHFNDLTSHLWQELFKHLLRINAPQFFKLLTHLLSESEFGSSNLTRCELIHILDMLVLALATHAQSLNLQPEPTKGHSIFGNLINQLCNIIYTHKITDKEIVLPALALLSQLKALRPQLLLRQLTKKNETILAKIVSIASQIDPCLEEAIISFLKQTKTQTKQTDSTLSFHGQSSKSMISNRLERQIAQNLQEINRNIEQGCEQKIQLGHLANLLINKTPNKTLQSSYIFEEKQKKQQISSFIYEQLLNMATKMVCPDKLLELLMLFQQITKEKNKNFTHAILSSLRKSSKHNQEHHITYFRLLSASIIEEQKFDQKTIEFLMNCYRNSQTRQIRFEIIKIVRVVSRGGLLSQILGEDQERFLKSIHDIFIDSKQ